MTTEPADSAPIAGAFTETASGRSLVGVVDLTVFGRRSNRRGAVRLAVHGSCVAATGTLVWLAPPAWWLVPAMLLHGLTLVTMFAAMHECTHRTAFASTTANDIVGWLTGLVGFYNSTFYRYYHGWHHRFTQDPARDPELMFPRAADLRTYATEIAGLQFWWRRVLDYPRLALGLAKGLPFVPERARREIAVSMSCQLLVYAAVAAVSIAAGSAAALYFWVLPSVLALPLLRAYLITEHTGCSRDQNGLSNTRTTLAVWPIRLLMWNMPFHAEHHLFPRCRSTACRHCTR